MALMITMSKSAAAAQKYFSEHLGQSDYLSQDGARPGLWFGKGAERLGLKGEVAAQDFIALAGNRDPKTGERLSVRDVANARPGYDFTFSPPKSVSALWARAGDERLAEAFRHSVLDTLRDDIEPRMRTRLRRGGQDGNAVTGNLATALFAHDTTRPLKEDGKPDPHLHMHAYVFNRTWAAHEGRWQAAQLGELHLDGRYLEAAFQARLGARLRGIGYALERDGKGSWEIVGVPGTVLDKFSRRKFEVEAEAKKRGVTDPAAKAQLAGKTRQSKDDGEQLSTQALHDYWNGRLSAKEAQALDAAYAQAQDGGDTGGRAAVTPPQAVRHALQHFFGPDGRNSAEDERDVLEQALRYGAGGALPEEAGKELDRHDLIRADIGGRTVCTTETVLAEEQALVKSVWSGRNSCLPLADGRPYVPGQGLSREQADAVAQLLDAQDRVQMFLGKSGTSKTTALRALDDALRQRGRQLVAFAPTARASRGVLRGKGFTEADTVASLLANPELQAQTRGNVILIDEAGLAGTRALGQVVALVEKQQAQGYDTRLLLVGDPRQHRGVPRGQVLHILQDQAGLTPARLAAIRRQEDPAYRQAIEDLSEGRVEQGFDRLDALGFIREIEEPEERYRALAKDYADTLEAGQTAMIVAPTHAEGNEVGAAVREELRGRGLIGAEDRRFVRYESKGLTQAQRMDAARFEQGDATQWNQNAPGFRRGEQVTVVDRQDGRVQVVNEAGQVKELPLALAGRFELYRASALQVAEGDRLRITRNGYTAGDKPHRLSNGDVITVVGFTPEGGILDRRGWLIPASYGHLAHGVVTSHASQGTEAGVVFVAQSGLSRGASSAEQFYVSAGRGEKALRLYTDDKEALRLAVARSDRA
ncbi:MAG: MobF family relaxase, partial [Gemmataceae bacterium]